MKKLIMVLLTITMVTMLSTGLCDTTYKTKICNDVFNFMSIPDLIKFDEIGEQRGSKYYPDEAELRIIGTVIDDLRYSNPKDMEDWITEELNNWGYKLFSVNIQWCGLSENHGKVYYGQIRSVEDLSYYCGDLEKNQSVYAIGMLFYQY